MRRLLAAFLIACALISTFHLMIVGPTSAQSPDPLPPKGSESPPAPANSQPPPSVPIDRTLLRKIEPQLWKKLTQSGGKAVPFIVYLKAKADLASATAPVPLNAQGQIDFLARRTAIVNALQQTARSSQTGVLQLLTGPPPAGLSGQSTTATDVRSLWIVNAVAAKGALETVLALAARPDVAIIRLDKEIKLNRPASTQAVVIPTLQSSQWGITRIRADLVHDALNIDGSGIVVANIDSGVDWQHPALETKYRGYTGPGNLPLHIGNWYDATGGGAQYPVDGNGHGTHTMGTMVGDQGIGVAPGAQWIAVRAFGSSGGAQNSWLHDAFQWILAPNGDPALAPDIVNNSWSNNIGFNTEFEADIQALLNAGVFPVFAAGNSGPDSGSVGSPASLDIAFSVGATADDEQVSNFSSRGPSPWGRVKPEVSAPGQDVVSALPGGTYISLNGTSMATPHVAGLAALLLQASPPLSSNLSQLSRVITSTAVQFGDPNPNDNYGWGRIDAYNAVMSVASVGTMEGTVTQTGSGLPISGATIKITPHAGGPTINAASNGSGTYTQGLAANTYDAVASAFGYQSVSAFNITVTTGTTTIQNFSLALSPVGTLQGTVKDKATNAALSATVSIDGTPASTTTDPSDGSYSLSLPVGVYTATVVAAQHRITKAVNITINDSAVATHNFLLDSAPGILLVDGGVWYQESQIDFYQQALDTLLYPYDIWQISAPFDTPNDIPPASTLSNYDIVIWSAPEDSPGYVGAGPALESFLSEGGKLLLSGQDVAFFDGGGFIFSSPAPYLKNYLKVDYVQDDANSDTVDGITGEFFSGLSLTISGGDGADNQTSPDVIEITNDDVAASSLSYGGGALAGLHVGFCLPYRAVVLPFGFEAINSLADRTAVMERTIDWLLQTPSPAGLKLTEAEELRIGDFGSVVSHTFRVFNSGTNSDTYSFTVGTGTPYNWPLNPAPPPSVSVPACEVQEISFGVVVDTVNTWHISDTLTITAQSSNNSALIETITRTTKSPAPVLLVEDDRWISVGAAFEEALASNNLSYDYYAVPKSWSGPLPPSPPLETLQLYPMTVWFTGSDWFSPLVTAEEDRLAAYLEGGGRLLFTGQDYIYDLPEHKPSPFTQNYLGVISHTEDFSSTSVTGELDNLVGTHLGPYSLTFPPTYNNWTDALTPTAAAQIASRGQANQPNGVIHAGVGAGGEYWHTNFLAYGPELLDSADRARLMQRSLGWLSWLGRSIVTPDASVQTEGAIVTYTAAITNDGWYDLPTAHFTATFPAELTPGSHSPELSSSGGDLVWSGPLGKGQNRVFTYTATIAGSLPLGTVIKQTSWLAYPDHNIRFDRVATVKVNFPDLATSAQTVTPATDVEANDPLTYTINLRNTGLADAPGVTTTNTLPPNLELVSLGTPSQGSVSANGNSFTWTTSLAKEQVVTLTYRASISYETSSAIENTAYADDGISNPVALTARTSYRILPIYLPAIFKDN